MILSIVLTVWSGVVGPLGPAAATSSSSMVDARAAECVLAIDGHDVRDFADADGALRLDAHDVVQIDTLSSEPTSITHIAVDLPIGPSIPVKTLRHQPAQRFTEVLRIADISDIGVGWYHIEVRSGPCRAAFWVRVDGRSPFTTVIGIGATLTLGLGVFAVVGATRRHRRRRSSTWWGAAAGILVGVGLCLLAQEFSVVAFTPIALLAFLGGGAAVGGGTTVAGGSVAGRGAQSAAPPPAGQSAVPSVILASPVRIHAVPTATEPGVDPPRRAYARIECDEAVVAESTFDVTVGLSATPVSGVVGSELVRPPSSVGDYELTAHLVADGFALAAGESWRKTMMVTATEPYPFVVFALVAPTTPAADRLQAINVLYSVDSQTMGLGTRCVRIVGSVAELGTESASPMPGTVGSLGVPVADQPPDITVRILRGSDPGRLMWSFESPHTDLVEEGRCSIGEDPDAFARTVISTIAAHEGRPTLALGLHGIGLTIAAKVPPEMWGALSKVATSVAPRRPTVLLLSEEAYVPWELASMPVPIDASTPGFLGAQTTIGRWVLAADRPALPPPRLVHVDGMIVITGRYEMPGWSRLEHAEAEAAALVERYHAVEVDAVTDKVVGCLLGDPAADVLHFSLHGKYDPGTAKQGLVLVDGEVIDPLVVKGGSLTEAPLVFLNACQVGTGQDTLGDYAGLAESFLFAGASAVVAPLWSIDDGAASALAERFYARAFAGESIAEIVRSERAAFGSGDIPNSSTLVAFQFFGHPVMHLEV